MDWQDRLVYFLAPLMSPVVRFFYPFFYPSMGREKAIEMGVAVASTLLLFVTMGTLILAALGGFWLVRRLAGRETARQYRQYEAEMARELQWGDAPAKDWTRLPPLPRPWTRRLGSALFRAVELLTVAAITVTRLIWGLLLQKEFKWFGGVVVWVIGEFIWIGLLCLGAVWLLKLLRLVPAWLRKAWSGSPVQCRKL